MTFSVGFNPLLVLLASLFNPHASWRIGTLDYVCGALSILGTVAWLLTRNADVALAAAILADALAALPTIRKGLISPGSESGSIYVGGSSIRQWPCSRPRSMRHIAFPATGTRPVATRRLSGCRRSGGALRA